MLNTYIGMLSPASGPAVLHWGNEVINLYLVSLEIQPWWSGLLTRIAFDLVGRAKNNLVRYGVLSAYDMLWSRKRHGKRTLFTKVIEKSTTYWTSFQGNVNQQISFVRYHRQRGESYLLAKWKTFFLWKLVKVMRWRCHSKLTEHVAFLARRYEHFWGIGHIRFVNPHEMIEWDTCSQGCFKTKFRNPFDSEVPVDST